MPGPDVTQQVLVDEANKAEHNKKTLNLQLGNASLAKAALLQAQEQRLHEERRLASLKSSQSSKKDPVEPVKNDTKQNRKDSKKQDKKKKNDNAFDASSSIFLTPSQHVKLLYAAHKDRVTDIFVKAGVFSTDETIKATQEAALSGITVTAASTTEQQRIQQKQTFVEQQMIQAQQNEVVVVEPDFQPIEAVVQEVKVRDRQRVAAAMALNPDYNVATSAPVVHQYVRAVSNFETSIYQFSTDYATRAPQYPRGQLSTTLAAWLEIQLLGRSQRLKDLHTNNLFVPAFFNQLQIARSSRVDEDVDAGNSYKSSGVGRMSPFPTRPYGF